MFKVTATALSTSTTGLTVQSLVEPVI